MQFFRDEHLRELFGRVPGELAAHLHRLRSSWTTTRPRRPAVRMRKTDVDHYLPGAVLPRSTA